MHENSLRQEYTILTPENVTFSYDVVGIGNRFLAALIDMIVLGIILLLVNLLLLALLNALGGIELLFGGLDTTENWGAALVIAIYSLLSFVLIWGYFLLFELLWNGQTPGKRFMKIRVVRMDGNPAGFGEIAVRNLVRIVDFMPAGYAAGFVTMFLNEKARRLGDLAAGTIVVKDRTMLALADLVTAAEPVNDATEIDATDPLYTRFATIRQLTRADFQLITELLKRHQQTRADVSLLRRLADQINQRLELSTNWNVQQSAPEFLTDVAAAYRRYGKS